MPLAIHAVSDQVITRPTRVFASGFGAGAVAGCTVLRGGPAVIDDDRTAPTHEDSVEESEAVTAGAEVALAFT